MSQLVICCFHFGACLSFIILLISFFMFQINLMDQQLTNAIPIAQTFLCSNCLIKNINSSRNKTDYKITLCLKCNTNHKQRYRILLYSCFPCHLRLKPSVRYNMHDHVYETSFNFCKGCINVNNQSLRFFLNELYK